MSTILTIIKNAFFVWSETTAMFWEQGGFSYYFFTSLFVLLIFDKRINRKLTYVGYTVVVLLGLYNPITYYLCKDIFNGSNLYFARLYTLIPVPFLIAYAGTFLIEKYKGFSKLILFILIGGIIILGGNSIYREDWVQRCDNYYKLSDDTIELCNLVHGYKEHVRLAAPTDLATEVRQYDGSIMMPYARRWSDDSPLRKLLDSDTPDAGEVMLLAGKDACDFVVVKKNEVNKWNYSGQSFFGETDNYYVYLVEGVIRVQNKYNELCQKIEVRHIDEKDSLMLNDEGWAIKKQKYDSRGDITQISHYGLNGEPITLPQGYYSIIKTYDRRHNVLSMKYLDVSGEPVISSDCFAEIRYEYNKKDKKTAEYYFDEEEKATSLGNGSFGKKYSYEDQKIKQITYVNSSGSPITTNYGFSIARFKYNDCGEKIAEYYYDVNDNPINKVSGEYGKEIEYDDSGRMITVKFIDESNLPAITSYGYSEVKYNYDVNGKYKEEYYYDKDGVLTVANDGQYGIRSYYDDKNRVIKTEYLDRIGNSMNGLAGFCYKKNEYNDYGYNIAEYYYDEDNNPVQLKSGEYGRKKELNEKSQVSAITFLGKDRKPTIVNSGYTTVKYVYDKHNNIIEEWYYDEDGKTIKSSAGAHGCKKEYNDKDLLVKVTYVDEKGTPVKTSSGYSILEKQYNDKNNLSAEYYYDEEGKPTLTNMGYCGYIRQSNICNRGTSITYLDMEHNPTNTRKGGYSTVTYEYASNGRVLKEKRFGKDGSLVENIDNQTWTINQYSDDSGNQAMFYTIQNNVTDTLIVIDGGWTENADHVREVIKELGGTVDAWIITHFHEDHVGAYNAIQQDPQGISIKKVYAPRFDHDYDKFLEVAQYWDDADTMKTWMDDSYDSDKIYYPSRGETVKIDDLKITFLNTYDDKLIEINGEKDLPNNCALVTLIEGKEDSMLFMSDMYSPEMGEHLIDTYGEKLKVDYLQPCHHGNSIMPTSFFEYINPDVMIFDAPKWLMEDENRNAKKLKGWCDENDIITYDYKTEPNEFDFK